MTEQELLDQIRAGVTQEMESALAADINPVLMHAVTQSYLLLKILERLRRIDGGIKSMSTFAGELCDKIEGANEGMKESPELESFTEQFKAVVLARYGITLTDEACRQEYEEINRALNGRRNEQ